MTRPMIKASAAALVPLALGACSTVQDAIAYGKGPFDHGPIPRSETALEGLHESSWGNSGKWGAKEPKEGDTAPTEAEPSPEEAQEPPEKGSAGL